MGAPARRWAEDLAAWAIPEEILARAPEDPWALPVGLFARAAAEDADTPSRARAREAVPPGGTVLDVGCGAGAAGFALADRAGEIVGVDESEGMLAAFAEIAAERGIAARSIRGRWPDVADDVGGADVVVCHHVLYNVADVVPFVRALDDHARSRVVVELTAEHPRAWMNPFWERFWGLERPTRPTAEDAVAVVRSLGIACDVQRWDAPGHATDADELVPMLRRHLCLPADRDDDVRAALDAIGRPSSRALVTLWWDA